MPAEQAEQVTALNVKPIFGFDARGALTPVGKARGMNGAVRSLAHEAGEAAREVFRVETGFGARLAPRSLLQAGSLQQPAPQQQRSQPTCTPLASPAFGAETQPTDAAETLPRVAPALRIRYLHAGNEEVVERVRALLACDDAPVRDYGTCLCGATIGTHVGPGAIGFACMPEPLPAARSAHVGSAANEEFNRSVGKGE